MGGFSTSEHNASVRGFIMRCLVQGYHYSYTVKGLSNKLVSAGLISTPDISSYLYYLIESGFIVFTESNVTAFNALEKDAVARLTLDGIKFIESGGNPDMGIDL